MANALTAAISARAELLTAAGVIPSAQLIAESALALEDAVSDHAFWMPVAKVIPQRKRAPKGPAQTACFQFFRFRIAHMAAGVTPYFRARWAPLPRCPAVPIISESAAAGIFVMP